MKIQCDVCKKEEATVFCTADEAALCVRCDRRVHHANKLAGKHLRFPLLSPSSSTDYPVCDICQKRRGLLFCQEDRAILCRECDIPIHKANQHTEKHNRFLLSGIKLSASEVSNHSTETDIINSVSNSNSTLQYSTTPNQEVDFHNHRQKNTSLSNEGGSGSTSSISEYLMETLPGWHFDDFLDPSSPSPCGFCKNYNEDMLPYIEVENNIGSVSFENLWVPQSESYHNIQFQDWNGQKMEGSEEVNSTMRQYLNYEDNFKVPHFMR